MKCEVNIICFECPNRPNASKPNTIRPRGSKAMLFKDMNTSKQNIILCLGIVLLIFQLILFSFMYFPVYWISAYWGATLWIQLAGESKRTRMSNIWKIQTKTWVSQSAYFFQCSQTTANKIVDEISDQLISFSFFFLQESSFVPFSIKVKFKVGLSVSELSVFFVAHQLSLKGSSLHGWLDRFDGCTEAWRPRNLTVSNQLVLVATRAWRQHRVIHWLVESFIGNLERFECWFHFPGVCTLGLVFTWCWS